MSDHRLFTTVDPLKNKVYLEQKTWENHIIDEETGHPEFKGRVGAIKSTINDPNLIFSSSTKQGSLVYFKLGAHRNYPKLYVKVPVDYSQGKEGRIQTAMLQGDFQGASLTQEGDIKYVKRN